MGVIASPGVLVIILVGSICAVLFYLWRGKKLSELLLYIPASIIGFLIGHLVGTQAGIALLVLGDIHLLEGILGSAVALFLASWLKLQ
jgi:hypothetical protein